MSRSWVDRLELPAYTAADAARLAGIAPQTLAGWFYGYPHSAGERAKPVFSEGKPRRRLLSYLQLVEVAFVATCRQRGLSLKDVRGAREFLAAQFHSDHPFADLRLVIEGPHIIARLPGASRLVAADMGGQVMWNEVLTARIHEFDYEHGIALRWHPRGRNHPVVVDPRLNFGAPSLERAGVATWAVADARRLGQTEPEIAKDFHLQTSEVRAALDFEGLALAA